MVVEIEVFLTFLLIDGRIQIRKKITDPDSGIRIRIHNNEYACTYIKHEYRYRILSQNNCLHPN
jgi:hypothetical protein